MRTRAHESLARPLGEKTLGVPTSCKGWWVLDIRIDRSSFKRRKAPMQNNMLCAVCRGQVGDSNSKPATHTLETSKNRLMVFKM